MLTQTQPLFMYAYNFCQKWNDNLISFVIVSKWALSIIWQVCYNLCKICFFYKFYRPNEKSAKVWCFAPTSLFCSIFTDDLSIWTYPFIIIYLNIIKFFHLIHSKNKQRKFYATTAPCFWTMPLLVLLKIILWTFFKKR